MVRKTSEFLNLLGFGLKLGLGLGLSFGLGFASSGGLVVYSGIGLHLINCDLCICDMELCV